MFLIKIQNLKGKNSVPHSSLLPICISFSILGLALALVSFMHGFIYGLSCLFLFGFLLIYLLIRWWRELFREFSTYEKKIFIDPKDNTFTLVIEPANVRHYLRDFIKGTKVAMILFIISEVMFFLSFFWAFFHSLGSPAIQIGCTWPPFGLETTMPNPLLIPLLNTIILLSSGVTVTWAHFSLLPLNSKALIKKVGFNYYWNFVISMFFTLILALNFIGWQGYEFIFNSLQMSDGIFGSSFYILTGFHGMHVIIGTIFLSVFFFQVIFEHHFINRLYKKNKLEKSNFFYIRQDFEEVCFNDSRVFSNLFGPAFLIDQNKIPFGKISIKYIPSVGFDCAVWYWHFVDVVWLFLFSFVYLPDYISYKLHYILCLLAQFITPCL